MEGFLQSNLAARGGRNCRDGKSRTRAVERSAPCMAGVSPLRVSRIERESASVISLSLVPRIISSPLSPLFPANSSFCACDRSRRSDSVAQLFAFRFARDRTTIA